MKILLSGHEASKKILPASSYLLNKYLPEYDIHFLNYGDYTGKLYCGRYIKLLDKQDGINAWASDISRYLRELNDEYIIFSLDDFLIGGRNDVDLLVYDIVCLLSSANPLLLAYSVTTQYTVWNRLLLLELLSRFKNPWDFETGGSQYFNSTGGKSKYINFLNYDDGSALSKRHPGKVNVKGLDRDDVETLIDLGHFQREDLILGQPNGPVPNYA